MLLNLYGRFFCPSIGEIADPAVFQTCGIQAGLQGPLSCKPPPKPSLA
ncbi:hypothetical protein C4K25_4829 [Pseudomonas chlororaphis]|nr:hypothetical protein C4K25_4829 [Pseudomonas chlororaphis]